MLNAAVFFVVGTVQIDQNALYGRVCGDDEFGVADTLRNLDHNVAFLQVLFERTQRPGRGIFLVNAVVDDQRLYSKRIVHFHFSSLSYRFSISLII
ncbi:unknown [Azospirillum sp. CAG:239]|nr:unknown [Azospirillum sp. CAG:239]